MSNQIVIRDNSVLANFVVFLIENSKSLIDIEIFSIDNVVTKDHRIT